MSAPISYDAYGQVRGGATLPRFGYTGELQDAATGQVYLRARWYNAASGRFGSRDAYAGDDTTPYSLHSYQYGYANPVSNTDPTGWCAQAGQGDDYCRKNDMTDRFLNDFQRLSHHEFTLASIGFRALAKTARKFLNNPALNVVDRCILASTEERATWNAYVAFALLVGPGQPADVKVQYQRAARADNIYMFERTDRT